MAVTITLKNIPDAVYTRLKESAQANHRSINSEAIVCLEKTLLSARINPEEHLARARKLRSTLNAEAFETEDIADAIAQGRA